MPRSRCPQEKNAHRECLHPPCYPNAVGKGLHRALQAECCLAVSCNNGEIAGNESASKLSCRCPLPSRTPVWSSPYLQTLGLVHPSDRACCSVDPRKHLIHSAM